MKALGLLALIVLSACTMSKDEFRAYTEKMEHTSATMPKQSFQKSHELMVEFASKCLGWRVTEIGGPFSTDFTPEVDVEKGKTTLYLRRVDHGSFGSKVDHYVFMAELKEGPKNSSTCTTSYHDSVMGHNTSHVSKELLRWVKQEKKLCPKLI